MTQKQGPLKAALIQFNATDDKADNLKRALMMTQEALKLGAGFVLLPEVFNFRGDPKNKTMFRGAGERIPGVSSKAFMPLALKHRAHVLLGSIIEKTASAYFYNTSVLIGPSGKIIAKYRKIHLFDARLDAKIITEADCFRPGNRTVTAPVAGFKAGLSICYDLRFPALYQRYAHQGAGIVTVPACFTRRTGQAHWETLLRARAIENLAYVLAPAQVGADGRGVLAHGHSMIVSPWGEVLACGSGDKEEIIFGHIDIEEIKKARQALPGIIERPPSK
ncbi:MAG: carbon-nitrogen hydrolase family protein [Candidatus Omnitrophica bacterium]|nr:carbon-nitrogen hydrolase family protein [Candidatus Omnitrophota bacterium]